MDCRGKGVSGVSEPKRTLKQNLIEQIIITKILLQKLELQKIAYQHIIAFTYFLARFVYIEDPENQQKRMSLFAVWTGQRKVAAAFFRYRRIITLKARQLGLTWLTISYALWRMMFNPGYKVVALSKREQDAKEMVRRLEFILRHLPGWMIVEKKNTPKNWQGLTWESTTLTITIHHPPVDGEHQEDTTFTSMSAAPDSGRSFTADLVILDEWAFQPWAREIYSAAYPTINRPTSGQVIGLSTAKRGTLFEDIWNAATKGLNNFYPIFLPWWTDPRRDKKWHEDTIRELPLTHRAEYPATPEEAFTVGEGAFFPFWDPDQHVLKSVPGYYPPSYCLLYRAYDAGFGSRACCKWYAVYPHGKAICYREYYPHQVIDTIQAKTIKEMSVTPNGEPESIYMTVADPSAWNKQSGTGESTAEIFAQEGIYMSAADNNLHNGWRRLHQWLYPIQDKDFGESPSLMFTYACGNSIRTYPSCEQSKTNPEDISKDSEHHCFVAGTLVETIDGYKPIEGIHKGDLVLTSEGYYPVKSAGATGREVAVITATFSNGRSLTGTGNHPIKTANGAFVPLDGLRYCDIIEVRENINNRRAKEWKKEGKKLCSMGHGFSGIQDLATAVQGYTSRQHLRTEEKGYKGYTGKSGNLTMGLFRKAGIFITETKTRLTMTLATWSVCPKKNICQTILRAKNFQQHRQIFFKQGPEDGTSHRKGASGTLSMESASWQIENSSQEPAPIVESKERQKTTSLTASGSALMLVSRTSAGKEALTTRSVPARYAEPNIHAIDTARAAPAHPCAVHVLGSCPAGTATVYNLEVDGPHEYYANGILVSNCQDCDRYFCMARPAPFKVSDSFMPGRSDPLPASSFDREEYTDIDDDTDWERTFFD